MRPIVVRRYEEADVAALFEAATESVTEVGPWLPWCHAGYARDEAETWVKRQIERWNEAAEYQFAILSPSGRYLGGCGINDVNVDHRYANLGYWVRSSECGTGVAPAAVRAVRDWAFANTNLERLEIVVAIGNTKSERVAEKAGAVREGTLRARLYLDGRPHDVSMFSITRSDVDQAPAEIAARQRMLP